MAATRAIKRVRASKSMDWDCRLEEVLVSQITDRTFVIYSISDGEYEDIATNIERRVAIFVGPWNKDLRTEITTAMGSSSYGWFEGLPGALTDDVMETTQQADKDAQEQQREEERLTNPERVTSWDRNGQKDQKDYAAFWEAVDQLAEGGEESEELWEQIDTWRLRYAMQNEK